MCISLELATSPGYNLLLMFKQEPTSDLWNLGPSSLGLIYLVPSLAWGIGLWSGFGSGKFGFQPVILFKIWLFACWAQINLAMLACRAFELLQLWLTMLWLRFCSIFAIEPTRAFDQIEPRLHRAFIVQGKNGARTLVSGLGPFQRYFPFNFFWKYRKIVFLVFL